MVVIIVVVVVVVVGGGCWIAVRVFYNFCFFIIDLWWHLLIPCACLSWFVVRRSGFSKTFDCDSSQGTTSTHTHRQTHSPQRTTHNAQRTALTYKYTTETQLQQDVMHATRTTTAT